MERPIAALYLGLLSAVCLAAAIANPTTSAVVAIFVAATVALAVVAALIVRSEGGSRTNPRIYEGTLRAAIRKIEEVNLTPREAGFFVKAVLDSEEFREAWEADRRRQRRVSAFARVRDRAAVETELMRQRQQYRDLVEVQYQKLHERLRREPATWNITDVDSLDHWPPTLAVPKPAREGRSPINPVGLGWTHAKKGPPPTATN